MEQRTSSLAPAQFWGGEGNSPPGESALYWGLAKSSVNATLVKIFFYNEIGRKALLFGHFLKLKNHTFFEREKLGWNI